MATLVPYFSKQNVVCNMTSRCDDIIHMTLYNAVRDSVRCLRMGVRTRLTVESCLFILASCTSTAQILNLFDDI